MQVATIVSPKVSRSIGTALTQVGGYTPAGATGAIVSCISVCNTSGAAVTVQVTVFDGANDTNLAFNAPVAVGDSLVLGGGLLKVTLVNGWSIRVKSSAVTSVDAVVSVTEFT